MTIKLGFDFENSNIIIESGKKTNKRKYKGKSMLVFPNDYTVIDLETTGLDPYYCDIIEIAAIRIRNNKIADSFQSLVNIGYPLDEFITELTGITDEMLENAPDIQTVLPKYLNFIDNDIVVGHNVNFDINFIYDSAQKNFELYFTNDFVDTMRLSRRIFPELKHHRQKDMKELFKIKTEKDHRALSDCETCFYILDKCKQEVVRKYGNVDNFYNTTNKYPKYIDTKTIIPETDIIDTSNPLYNRECVFTGTLEKMTRKEAMQLVVNLGGTVKNNITKKTNLLILGNYDYCLSIKDGKSSKHKKAEQQKLKGQDIDIVSEEVFYEMIGL